MNLARIGCSPPIWSQNPGLLGAKCDRNGRPHPKSHYGRAEPSFQAGSDHPPPTRRPTTRPPGPASRPRPPLNTPDARSCRRGPPGVEPYCPARTGGRFSPGAYSPGTGFRLGAIRPGPVFARGLLSPGAYCRPGPIVARGLLSPGAYCSPGPAVLAVAALSVGLPGALGVVDLDERHPDLGQPLPQASFVFSEAALKPVHQGGQGVDGQLRLWQLGGLL